jgi:hypothetical protein
MFAKFIYAAPIILCLLEIKFLSQLFIQLLREHDISQKRAFGAESRLNPLRVIDFQISYFKRLLRGFARLLRAVDIS